MEKALQMLVADREVASDRIVAWSRYDLEVIERHCQSSASLLKEIAARFENALTARGPGGDRSDRHWCSLVITKAARRMS
jgi:hypothetical protein